MAQFHTVARLALRAELVRRKLRGELPRGVSVADVMDAATDEAFDLAAAQVADASGGVGAFGDGALIQGIIDFFKSDAGKQVLDALIRIVLSFLA